MIVNTQNQNVCVYVYYMHLFKALKTEKCHGAVVEYWQENVIYTGVLLEVKCWYVINDIELWQENAVCEL